MQVGDLVEIKKNWKSIYPIYYRNMVALVVGIDSGYVDERPVGFRRIRILHGDIDGQVYSVFAEDVLKVVKN